jgi:hypothetical protein
MTNPRTKNTNPAEFRVLVTLLYFFGKMKGDMEESLLVEKIVEGLFGICHSVVSNGNRKKLSNYCWFAVTEEDKLIRWVYAKDLPDARKWYDGSVFVWDVGTGSRVPNAISLEKVDNIVESILLFEKSEVYDQS